MRRLRIGSIGKLLLILSSLMLSKAWAFNSNVHELVLNRRAAQVSILNGYLKENLGLSDGLATSVNGRTIQRWIEAGGAAEDTFLRSEILGAAFRSRHHFHNPLLPWDQAGLNALSLCPSFVLLGQASVRWAQNPDQGISGHAAWVDARRAFRDALTLETAKKREAAFAQTFQIVGQQMHLIADLAVPAHTRNDQHCPTPEGFEAWASDRDNQAFIGSLIAGEPTRPDTSIFSLGVPIDDPIARVPVARLWDTDQYNLPNPNPDVTFTPPGTKPTVGLAEYTNANFFSDDTAFQRFPFPAATSVQLTDPPELEPKTGEKRRYFKKVRDGDFGYRLAVPSALFDFLPDALKDRKKGLDDNVFRDYATKLLPRAVGYSAALLDYFFRGKLDADLLLDPNDPSLLTLAATNASSEALAGGTLTVYTDNPATGMRDAVASASVAGPIPQGQDLFATPLSVPVTVEDPERSFLAVYRGTLGGEAAVPNTDPNLDFPGGVIGKVLGGVRVEEIFSDGVRWKLRTPKGVFLLPLMAVEFEDVRWGDGDNILVARTPFGPPDPAQPNRFNRVVAYELQRQTGSVEPVTVDTPDGPEAQLTKKTEVLFPFGRSLGTTVDLSHNTQFVQRVAKVDPRRNVFVWKPRPPFCPTCGEYVFDHADVGIPQIEVLQAVPISFKEQFVIRLDLERNAAFGTVGEPYIWDLQEVGADTLGRPLAVVVVTLTTPASPPVTVPVKGLNSQSGLPEVVGETSVGPSFPPAINRSLWAVVNLATGEVVSTAAAFVTLAFDEGGVGGLPDVYEHGILEFTGGGPNDGMFQAWGRVTPGLADPQLPVASVTNVQTGGSLAVTQQGWLKDELRQLPDPFKDPAAGLGLLDVQLGSFLKDPVDLAFDCPADAAGVVSCHLLRISESSVAVVRGSFELFDARRSRPAPAGGERLVFSAEGPNGVGIEDTVLAWDPPTRSARVLTRLPPIGEGFHLLGPATGTTLLVPGPDSFLVSLDGAQPPTKFPGINLGFSFTLLEPGFLYSIQDLKFFRPKPPLQRTALPANLATLPDGSNPVGDYHAIRVSGRNALSLLP